MPSPPSKTPTNGSNNTTASPTVALNINSARSVSRVSVSASCASQVSRMSELAPLGAPLKVRAPVSKLKPGDRLPAQS